MKYCYKHIVLLILLATTSGKAVFSQNPSTQIVFTERVHKFGTIKEEKGKVSHTFIFENKGKTPVEIDEVNTGCGCLAKAVSKEAIRPGEKGKITITFDPGYKSGFFSKEIVVFSNKGKDYNRIWVEGVIEPMEHPVEDEYPYKFGSGLYLRLKVIAFGYAGPGETKQMELHYANDTDKEMTLQFISDNNQDELQFTNPGRIIPKGRGVISFRYTMPVNANKDVSIKLIPYVNGNKLKETLELKILKPKN